MSESTLTPQTAPRDRTKLMGESPFQLRILVQKLGGFSTDEQKMAWHDMKTKDAQVDYVVRLLQGWDQANPGQAVAPPMQTAPQAANGAMPYTPPMMQAPPQQAPQQMQPPMQQMQPTYTPPGVMQHAPVSPGMMQAPQVPQVSPAAAQQATAATTETKTRRNPRTPADNSQAAAQPNDIGVELLNAMVALKTSSDAQVARYEQFQSYVAGLLQEASDAKNSRVTALEGKYTEVHAALQQMNQYLQSVSQVQIWTLMAFLTFMQESMGASMTDILGAAINDSAMFQQLVNKATGKA